MSIQIKRAAPTQLSLIEAFFRENGDSSESAQMRRKGIYTSMKRPVDGDSPMNLLYTILALYQGEVLSSVAIVGIAPYFYDVIEIATKISERRKGLATILLRFITDNFLCRRFTSYIPTAVMGLFEKAGFIHFESADSGVELMERIPTFGIAFRYVASYYIKLESKEGDEFFASVFPRFHKLESWDNADLILKKTDKDMDQYWEKIIEINRRFYNVAINHLRFASLISKKDSLTKLAMKEKYSFYPKTFIGDPSKPVPEEMLQWKRVIVKPTRSHSGQGITIQRNVKEFKKNYVYQKMIEPLLFTAGPFAGKKFDIRFLVYVDAGVITIFNKAYLRFSPHKYDSDDDDLKINLTNNSFHGSDKTILKVVSLDGASHDPELVYNTAGISQLENFIRDSAVSIVKKIFFETKIAGRKMKEVLFGDVYNGYELFGLDLMFDSQGRPYLFEINENPSFFIKEVDEELYKAVFTLAFEPTINQRPIPTSMIKVMQS